MWRGALFSVLVGGALMLGALPFANYTSRWKTLLLLTLWLGLTMSLWGAASLYGLSH